ncbi:GNAT family N-acetyltransferase [Paenibacillus monticola]|uniref:GNAT family N-acetyltransferase n=1 Tax=Paenibacillus monticola TaxID=2666075 RepID=A0A7X2L0R0_9BACL|nr:GNAT family N-acetyltransferase [Paenibacillus monticola]MRN52330.1 GNAT family N-acetyltransferase [Paenibacillus monticola]
MFNIHNLRFISLSISDLKQGLLDSFNRYQEVSYVWRTVEGERKLVWMPFIDNWDQSTKDEIIAENFHFCLSNGGRVICAEYNGEVIAFASLLRDLFGSEQQYADLMQLHVSHEFRHLGLGRKLFDMCVEQAEQWGASKLYISAHSSKETQAFYRSMGCVDALEVNEHHVELEPFDCQLEYALLRK